MKLSEHTDRLRQLIEKAFDKQFARLGLGKDESRDPSTLSPDSLLKRDRYEAVIKSHEGETGDYTSARAKLMDELAFTLFNRLAAMKVMEAAKLFPPVISKKTEHGDRSFGHTAWLEEFPKMRSEELDGIREYFKFAFDDLGETLPLFHKNYPYALLPDPISLNDIIDAYNKVEKDSNIDDSIWESDDILGWFYESYNNYKKLAHKESKAKTEFDKVSIQSQVYTPRWVVEFLINNSIGKLYLEMYPDSVIRNNYKIANAPTNSTRKIKPLHTIKMIDTACGSGNFLLYAFDFFYALYIDQIENYDADYDEDDIPRLIIENNLHGIDLDDRAVQLAQLGLFIKAKKKRRNLSHLNFNVVSSDFYLPDYDIVKEVFETSAELTGQQIDLIRETWGDLKNAYKFGSLVRVGSKLKDRIAVLETDNLSLFPNRGIKVYGDFEKLFFESLETTVKQYAKTKHDTFLSGKTRDAVTYLKLLTQRYDVAAANPPYTDSSDFGPELKKFIDENYKKPYKFNTNLYATFIKRCHELTNEDGKIAMIHPHTFMYIKTFEDVRKFIVEKTHIDAMVDFGLDRVNMFGPGILVDATFYVLSKKQSDVKGLYFNLAANLQEKFKKEKFLEALDNYISGTANDRVYSLSQSKLKIIKSWPFIYWISDVFREKFEGGLIENSIDIRAGIQTSNNNRFIRFGWEVNKDDIFHEDEKAIGGKKWVRYSKGGPYNKWFGNLWLVIDWENNGIKLQKYLLSRGQDLHAQEYYFQNGLTYSASGSKGASLRILPKNHLFDIGGSSIFLKKEFQDNFYIMGLLNSKLICYIIDCLNPTVNKQPGDLKRIPFVIPQKVIGHDITKLSTDCYSIKRNLCKYSIIEPDYKESLYRGIGSIKIFLYYANHLLTQVLINEAIINEKIFEVYELTEEDKAMVLAKEGESIGGLPVSEEARKAYLTEEEATKKFPLDNIREYIEQLPTKEFTEEEREDIKSGFPTLYQSNNDLEEFCIRHQVNPINVWLWFKQSNVIPQQRMHTLAMEFLADMIREILMEDEDGIIPLVPNAGEKILLYRIEEKFSEKGFTMAQYSEFDKVLGRELNDYLNNHFFKALSDHLNLFMYLPKTPFIWHITSGPEQGFDAYIIIYKWSKDKLQSILSVYLENRERSLINRQSDLANNDSAPAQEEKEKIRKQLSELESFKQKVDDLLEERYNPILDDGVGKNIAPLQAKGMLAYDVLNPGQLKKYLNADW
ncbi:MAG: BREX-1 system adenine-specific DNA-methyltransferase PglX [Candidatus Kapabacteria bacterium]|jgi:hypothetical protein|nr:BREX-1 system adenine-specific DNA-methyltransferase PglX [Candidatus Kapabacteria bacterium]